MRTNSWLLFAFFALCLLVACNDSAPPEGEPQVEVVATAGVAAATGNAAGATADAGAAAASVAPTPTPAPETIAGRIEVWHSWAESDADALAEILAAFQREYPNVTVDTLFVAYPDLVQAYADAVKAGGGPDLVLTHSRWLGDLAETGVVQPLDDLVPAAALNEYWPAALDNLRWEGQLYGLPTNFETVSLFVNNALANSTVPATTADLLAQARANPAQGAGLYDNLYHLFWGIPAYGGRLFDADGVAVLDQGGDVAGYLAWLRELSQTPGSYVDTDYGMLLDRFKKGEFAYFVDGPWAIGELVQALGDNLAVAPLPAGPGGPGQPWVSTEAVFVNPALAPEQLTPALAFARFLTNAESGATLARAARRLPGNRNSDLGNDPLLQGFMQQAAAAQPLPNLPEMEQAWGYGGDMLLKVVDGDADPAATVRETAALLNEANGK
jgi:maltose-binding protein MalE